MTADEAGRAIRRVADACHGETMRARSATPRPHPFGRAGRTVLQLLEPSTRLLGRHGAHAVVPAYPVPERPAAGPPRPIAGLGGRRRAGLAAPEGRRHRPMVRVHLRHELPLLGRLIALDRRDALGRWSSGRSSMPGARGFRRDASSPGPSRRTMPWPATPVPRGPAPAAIAVAERIAIDQRCQRVRAVGAALPERAIRTPGANAHRSWAPARQRWVRESAALRLAADTLASMLAR